MDDLRFACQSGCTSCCDQSGYVYLSEQDLRQAARRLRMSAAAFERRYVYRTRRRMRLRKPPDAECPFLLPAGCRIHPDKPTQCRVFPFWPELVEVPANWRAAARYCPGIGTGPLIQIGTALEASDQMRAAYPALYKGEPKPRQRRDSIAATARST